MFDKLFGLLGEVYYYFVYRKPARKLVEELTKDNLEAVYKGRDGGFKAYAIPDGSQPPYRYASLIDFFKDWEFREREQYLKINWVPLEQYQAQTGIGQRLNRERFGVNFEKYVEDKKRKAIKKYAGKKEEGVEKKKKSVKKVKKVKFKKKKKA